MKLRLFGVEIYISVAFSVILAFLLIVDKTGLMTASLAAILIHETGHFAAMKICGCAPKSVSLGVAGILITGSSFCTAKENSIIAVSGPLANLLAFAVSFVINLLTGNYILLVFAAVELLVAAINLLPVKGLDGGTLLYNLLVVLPKVNAGAVSAVISVFTASAVVVSGASVAVRNVDNPSLLLLGIYLLVLNLMKCDI